MENETGTDGSSPAGKRRLSRTENRRAERSPLACTFTMGLVLRAARMGWFDYQPATGDLEIDAQCRRLLGLGETEACDGEVLWSRVHPADREAVAAAFEAATRRDLQAPFDLDCRLISRDGSVKKWVHGTGQAIFEGEGEDAQPVRFVGTVQDVSQRRKSEVEAAAARERLELAQAAGRVGTFDWNLIDQAVTTTGMDHIYGIPPGDLEAWRQCVHPDDRGPLDAHLQEALEGKVPYDTEYRIMCADGSVRWVAGRGELHRDEGGNPVRFVGVNIDITERKRIVEQLRASERKVCAAFSNNPAAISLTRLEDGVLLEVNDRWTTMTGYRREEILGQSLRRTTFWPCPEECRRFLEELRAEGLVRGWEQVFHKKSGETFVAQLAAQCLDIDGDHAILTTFVDVTGRKRAEEALNQSLERLVLAQDAAKAGFWEWNLQTGEDAWSDVLWDLFGLEPHSRRPSREAWLGAVIPEDRERVERIYLEAAATGRDLNAEWRTRGRDGRTRWLMGRGRPERDASGRPVRYVGIVMDITARKEAEEALAAVNRELEAFTTSVSHDLRAPLRAIHGFSGLLEEKAGSLLEPETRRYLEHIQDNSLRMGRMIDDLLELSKTSQGKLRVTTIDTRALVADCWEELRLEVPSPARLDLGDLPLLRGDRQLVRQVFVNLLENAIKYTRGREMPLVSVRGHDRNGETLVTVEDNGIGFDMKDARRIFEPFQRLHSRRAYEGTGIGLATVRRAIERHGGRVWAESTKGEGASFSFALPKHC